MHKKFLQRTLLFIILTALGLSTFSALLLSPARVTAASCAEEGGNLLQNGTMAGDPVDTPGVVANNWTPFVNHANELNYEIASNEGYDPNGSQYIWSDYGTWDAGIYQKVNNLVPGQTYHFWMVWGQSLHDIAGNNARSTLINRQIGVDLRGKSNPNAARIRWSVPYFGGGGFNRPEWHLVFTARKSTATFYVRAQNGHTDGRNKVFFDTACLYPAGGMQTSTPWATPRFSPTPSNTPLPTATPIPNAIQDTDPNIVYNVPWQSVNDSLANNGTYHTARGQFRKGVSARYNFVGTKIKLYYVANSNHGKAKVFIDGVAVGVIDQYAPNITYALEQTFENLAPGAHTLKIKNAGGKNSSASDSYITLDALEFESGATTYLGRNIAQRVTPTPQRARSKKTPTPAPRLIPFAKANPAADPPDDPTVIWDARLPELNVYLEPANVPPGALYWKLIRADYHDPFQHGGDFGGDHNMFYVITDQDGNRIVNQKVWQSWPDDATSAFTDARGIGDIAMWANYWPQNGPGPYNGYVDGLPSDVVRGMGLPGNNHVSFVLYFQKTVKGDSASPTNTLTPTATATATATEVPLSATPTATVIATSTPPAPSPTTAPSRTPLPPPAGFVDDTNENIVYRGAWGLALDGAARESTYHYGAGVRGKPVVIRYNFTGTEITIHYIADQYQGRMRVVVDGKRRGVIDQYTPDARYGLSYTIRNLAPGAHRLKLKNAGAKNPAALDTFIVLDGLEAR